MGPEVPALCQCRGLPVSGLGQGPVSVSATEQGEEFGPGFPRGDKRELGVICGFRSEASTEPGGDFSPEDIARGVWTGHLTWQCGALGAVRNIWKAQARCHVAGGHKGAPVVRKTCPILLVT